MHDELKNNENTIGKSLRTLRTFINVAIRKKKMTENPFTYFRIKKTEGQREYLDLSELNKLHLYYHDLTVKNKVQKEVLLSFLFSCYTGLRYSDIRVLKIKNLKTGFIQIKTIKTNSMVTIPLSNKAIELINLQSKDHEEHLLKVYCNKVSNKHLKEISKTLGIEKKLTFHVARHTFATASLTLGIPIEVVSKLLGHTNIRTTQIYARIVDDLKVNEMKKWDRF
jgi:site-specific recombinase XerD